MGYYRDIRRPGLGGINNDVIDSEVSIVDTRYVRNAARLRGKDGKNGVVRNIKGNTAIPYTTPFGVDAKVIGKCRDEQGDGIIVLVADSVNGDGIFELYPKTDTVVFIVKDTATFKLNFSKLHFLRGAYVIGGKFYWNDAYNAPRKINLQKAKDFTAGLTTGYPSIDEQTISLIKYPYLYRIEPFYATDSAVASNNLRGYLFQFKLTYIYDDKEESVASPVSSVALPIGDTDTSGELVGATNTNNVLKFYINTGHHTVSKIGVYARIGNNGDWFFVETLDKNVLALGDYASYLYSFYNDSVTTGVDQVKMKRLYHSIPLVSDYMGYLHTNNLLLAGNLEGKDNLKPDVTLSGKLNQAQNGVSPGSMIHAYTTTTISVDKGTATEILLEYYVLIEGLNILPTANNLMVIDMNGQVDNFVIDALAAANETDFINDLVGFINNNFGVSAFTSVLDKNGVEQVPLNAIAVGHFLTAITEHSAEEWDTTAGSFKSLAGFKSGSTQSLGLLYYDDAGRSTFVQHAGKLYLPFPTEPGVVFPTSMTAPYTSDVLYSIDWQINHLPPAWATRYQWARQTNLTMTWFVRYIINGITNGTAATSDADITYVDISPLNLHKLPYNVAPIDFSFPNSSIAAYSFEKGDRIRFITKTKTDFSPVSGGGEGTGLGSLLQDASSNYYFLDMEILGYQREQTANADGTFSNTNSIMVQLIDATKYPNIGQYSLVEIYRPNKQKTDMVYYETGGMFDIIDSPDFPGTNIHSTIPSGSVASVGQDQTIDVNGNVVLPATGELTDGDIYIVPMIFDMNLAASGDPTKPISLVECMSMSVFNDLPVYNLGRTQIVDKDAKQQKFLSIRMSGKYFENSNLNLLSQFYGGKDLFVSAEWGNEITGVIEVGFTLKVLQPRKPTSFFVGRTGLQLATASGTDQIIANSDATISTQSPSPVLRGCMNPESILTVSTLLFYVDVLNGSVVQDGQNGIIDIEVYGVQKDIKDICTSLLTYPSYNIYSSYDPFWDMVVFSFQGVNADGTVDDKGTYYFDYRENKWPFVMMYGNAGKMPVFFTSIDQYYISFLGDEIWKHYMNPTFNNFYGNQLPVTVELIFNKDYGTLKLYKSIDIVGKGQWGAVDVGDVFIAAKNNADYKEQKSRLIASRFHTLRGKQNAYFLKDMNSTGSIVVENLRTGKDLKGNILFLRLTNTESTEAIIDTVTVTYQILGLT